ncbi:unnamed protein product [Mucor hiemalis]
MSTERVFLFGGTGNIGIKTVKDLLAKNVNVTLFARNPAKVDTLFPNANNLQVVQGDLSDLTPYKKAINGHTRLFLLLGSFDNFVALKTEIATIAYNAGVKQVIDVSSESVNYGWRTSYIGSLHQEAEQKILDIPNRNRFVTLRPSRFMSNILHFDRITPNGLFFDTVDADTPQSWISTNDIGATAAAILSEDVEKYGDGCYTLIGDVLTPNQRAKILSSALGHEVKYQRISAVEKYGHLEKLNIFPNYIALDLSVTSEFPHAPVSNVISIILRKNPETFEEYTHSIKNELTAGN